MLQASGDAGVRIAIDFMNIIVKKVTVPDEWVKSHYECLKAVMHLSTVTIKVLNY